MRCHVCNVAVGDGQRFCHECGESLEEVTARIDRIDASTPPEAPGDEGNDEGADDEGDVETVERVDAAEPTAGTDEITTGSAGAVTDTDGPADDVELATTEEVDVQASPASTETEPLRIVEATPSAGSPAAYEDTRVVPATATATSSAAHEPTTTLPLVGGARPVHDGQITDELPMTAPIFDGVDDVDQYTVESSGFKLRVSFILALLAVGAAVMASIADTIDIRTSRPIDGIQVGIRVLEDFGTNLAIAGFIGSGLMLAGALFSCFGLRWGAGMAGGAGLALAGWSVMTLGLVEVRIHTAEGFTRNAGPSANGFELEVTRDIGWFLIIAVGAIGILVFLTSLRMAGRGRRAGLNPWIAAVGAVGAVIFAAGPLIPLGEATFDLNFGFVGLPRLFFIGRLVALGLLAFTGVVGFLSVRTYGLGMVAGGLSIATWLWATSLAEFGDQPVGVAVGNLGTLETVPHAVTSVGLAVSLLMLAVATALATANRR